MLRARKQQVAQSQSLPAPIGGLNARDAVALMDPTDAIVLDNWFPSTTSVDLRKGYDAFATFDGDCETVIAYNGASAKVFVAIDDGTDISIIDATAGGAVSSAVVGGSGDTVHAPSNARYDYQNFATTGGQFLTLVNGSNDPLEYNGTAWSVSAITDGENPEVLDPADFFTVAVYAERLWYGEKDTFNVWYLPVQSITGTVAKLWLGSLFKLGGSLSNIITWSADTASQLADFIAFVSTEGEVVAFTGTDPTDADLWSRVAHFRIGKPVAKGNRAWTKMGAEAVLLTIDGLIPMSLAVMQDRADVAGAVSDKIRNSFNRDVALYGANFGWSVTLHPAGQKLVVNVPLTANSASRQYVMNTQTKAWCRFTGWNAFCFESTKDTLYWGGTDVLAKADTGLDDDGDSINGNAKQAFSYFGQRGRQKQMSMARPILLLDGPIGLGLSVDVDYQDIEPESVVPIAGNAGDPWSDAWDVSWAGASVVYKSWNSIRGYGFAIAPRIKVQSMSVNISWQATDFVYELGGIL